MIVASGLKLVAVWSGLGNGFCRGVADSIWLTLQFDYLLVTFCGVTPYLIFPSLNSLRICTIGNFRDSHGEASGNCAVTTTYGNKSRINGHSEEETDYSVFICCSEYYVSQRIQILKVWCKEYR